MNAGAGIARGLGAAALALALMTPGAAARAKTPPAAGGRAPAPDTLATTLILVRHAERDAAWLGSDPPLDPRGLARANQLASTLGHAEVAAIYTTEFRRCRETVAPLAKALGDTLRILTGRDFQAQAARLRRETRGRTALIVGHSDTIPQLIEALTGKVVPPFHGGEFDRLYIVTLHPGGSTIMRLRYGDPEPED